MEINAVFQLLLRRWWVILLVVLVTVGATLAFTLTQTPIYSATATYVVSPSPELLNENGVLSGLSILGGQPSVANTYATIAKSMTVRQNASKALGLDVSQTAGLYIASHVQSDTNLIELTVEGSDPILIQAFANSLGQSTVEYVNTLYEVYDMTILDGAGFPERPIRPNFLLNLAIGLMFGLLLGVGLAFLLGDSKKDPVVVTRKEREFRSGQRVLEDYPVAPAVKDRG